MSACNWELVRKLSQYGIKDLGSIQKVDEVMPHPTFGVEIIVQSDNTEVTWDSHVTHA